MWRPGPDSSTRHQCLRSPDCRRAGVVVVPDGLLVGRARASDPCAGRRPARRPRASQRPGLATVWQTPASRRPSAAAATRTITPSPIGDWAVQDEGDSTTGTVAHFRESGIRHTEVGRLVQHPTATKADRVCAPGRFEARYYEQAAVAWLKIFALRDSRYDSACAGSSAGPSKGG